MMGIAIAAMEEMNWEVMKMGIVIVIIIIKVIRETANHQLPSIVDRLFYSEW